MGRPGTRPSELALPVASLAALRHALSAEVGSDAAARALRAAGYAAGNALFAALSNPIAGGSPDEGASALGELTADTFWRRLSQLFSTRGWGNLTHASLHPGVGALETGNWVEAQPDSSARPSCYFTTGLLANLLGHVSGSGISVLEAECRSRGDARCRFLFGAPATLNLVYERLRAGADIEQTVESLV